MYIWLTAILALISLPLFFLLFSVLGLVIWALLLMVALFAVKGKKNKG
jgi:uncharacterized membrane protein YvlD (DUF360 family)